MRSQALSRHAGVLLAVVAALVLAATAVAETDDSMERQREAFKDKVLTTGQEAPDFELPRLRLEKNAAGELVGTVDKEKVKLSSLRGKKPVCLFMSSYT